MQAICRQERQRRDRAPDVGGCAVPPRCRRLSKDEEAYPITSETWIALALGALFLRRLCPSS